VHIDHVIWKAEDLGRTAARMAAEFGLTDDGGGRHVGIGTHNRVFPLGGGYLEVLAVADPEEAARSPLGQAIVAAPEGLFGWAVAVDDVDAQASRLSVEVMTIAREDLTARLAGVAEAMADRSLPFFIQRDAGIVDPGASGDAGGIAWLELAADAERLSAWLAGADLPLRLVGDDGPHGPRAMRLGSGTVIR
jgi:glyoxalase-like protein